jgi:PQQ enzyme repeat
MLLGPDEVVLRIQHRHHPDWSVWFGRATRHYWALASWVPGRDGFVGAAAPEALAAAIASVERRYPRPVGASVLWTTESWAANGVMSAGCLDGHMYAIDAATGRVLWEAGDEGSAGSVFRGNGTYAPSMTPPGAAPPSARSR